MVKPKTRHYKKRRTRKHKGGAPSKKALYWASKGLTRKNRPPPLSLPKSPSSFERKKQTIINNPLSPSCMPHIVEIPTTPPHSGQHYIIIDDEKKEIFKFNEKDTKLESTGLAYIFDINTYSGKWVKID